jgi:transaldolase
VIRESVEIFENYDLDCEVLAASIRGARDVTECALAGSHVVTLPSAVLFQMMGHPLTDRGIEIFLRDAQKYGAV